ncbi:MAG: serine/threonine protein kinase [bacterium]|nr:serine/threonine protein kinase [bacterium]
MSTSATAASEPGEPRFVPGVVLGGRYRIVGLLGRGGMGEVYRADDLKLGQSVALKFLPPGLENDPDRLARFLNEVKVALRITHPNVCRVYDIGEVDGAHYLSMEYIDGEDLASLLRRIGRLPEDKAVDIARQLCAGLAAAHEKGILHRDLKPANVMLDGRGDVRITDFGLAGLAAGFTGVEIRAGTPAYMAPEQHEGREVTTRSDIYALGVLLYELFTGKRAFDAKTAGELSELQHSGPASPTSHVSMLDPSVERVILRCLEEDPANRPASVLKVAVALPGADPLAAALAAGETPSPEMVAEAGDDSALEPKVAVPIMALTLLGLFVVTWIVGRYDLLGRVPMELPPQVLVHRAQEITQDLGYDDPPADSAHGFRADFRRLRQISKDPGPDRWDGLPTQRPTAIYLWYRQSPRTLVPLNTASQVARNDPHARITGMINLELGATGHLLFFQAVPPQYEEPPSEQAAEPDWVPAFEAAGLDLASFSAVAPRWAPEVHCDRRAAWNGTFPGQAEPEVRVEACSFRGRVVYFDLLFPWSEPWRQQQTERTATQRIQGMVGGLIGFAFVVGAVLLARRNLKLGRGDRRGATSVAAVVVAAKIGAWLFQASHTSNPQWEMELFARGMAGALFDGAVLWVLYIALEPFVRRRWPESLVSWNRLLAGRFRDPLVGRHLLYGAALGVGMELLQRLGDLVPTFFGDAQDWLNVTDLDTLLGTRWVLGEMCFAVRHAIYTPMTFLFLLVLFRVVLRNKWLALAAFVGTSIFLGLPDSEYAAVWAVTHSITWVAVGLVMMRYGLVSFIAAFFLAVELMGNQPLTLDFATWYAGSTLTALAVGVALVLYAFRVSLGGRALLAADE